MLLKMLNNRNLKSEKDYTTKMPEQVKGESYAFSAVNQQHANPLI